MNYLRKQGYMFVSLPTSIYVHNIYCNLGPYWETPSKIMVEVKRPLFCLLSSPGLKVSNILHLGPLDPRCSIRNPEYKK